MTESKQTVDSVNVHGSIRQSSDAENSQQTAKSVTAASLDQRVQSQPDSLTFGKYRAVGKWAVIALVCVLIAIALIKVLLSGV